jgi:hypothetical protein
MKGVPHTFKLSDMQLEQLGKDSERILELEKQCGILSSQRPFSIVPGVPVTHSDFELLIEENIGYIEMLERRLVKPNNPVLFNRKESQSEIVYLPDSAVRNDMSRSSTSFSACSP